MAGLFGGLPAQAQQGAVLGQYNPSALSGGDRMALFGAMLKDIGNGGQSNNVMDTQQMLAGRQLMQQQMGMRGALGGLFAQPTTAVPGGGQGAAPGAAGGGEGPGADPIQSAVPMLARAQAMGIDTAPYLALLKAANPEAVAVREGADLMNPRTGQVIGHGPAKTGVSEGFGWKVDPATGNISWTAERPMSYDDILNLMKFKDQQQQNAFQNQIALGQLGVARGNLGVSASHNAYEQGTGQKPKPWDRSWK